MKAGDAALAELQQADGQYKLRPILLLKQFPPFDDWLVCGISSQIRQTVPDLDEVIRETDDDFSKSGLHVSSVIRVGFLATLPEKNIAGTVGSANPHRHQKVLKNLIVFLNTDT